MGCVVFVIGLRSLAYLDTYPSVGGFPTSAAIIFVSIGAIMAIISFFGCFGAAGRRFSKILYIYGSLLLILLGVEIGTAVYGYIDKPNAKMLVEEELKHTLINYGPDVDYNSVWDTLQQNFECCGVGQLKNDSAPGYVDWKESTWYETNSGSVPTSCCINQTDTCGMGQMDKPRNTSTVESIYTIGCLHQFYVWFKTHIELAAGIGLGIFLFQCILIITSFALGNN